MITEAQLRRIALALPGAYEQATYDGWPSWRTKPVKAERPASARKRARKR